MRLTISSGHTVYSLQSLKPGTLVRMTHRPGYTIEPDDQLYLRTNSTLFPLISILTGNLLQERSIDNSTFSGTEFVVVALPNETP